jgi:hypothetical protein
MLENRRRFLGCIVPAGIVLLVKPAWQQTAPPLQRSGLPHNPTDIDTETPPMDAKRILKGNQQKIEEDVQRLFTLATELRDQVKNTDSTSVLSLALMQKAEEVEKLAHQIRTLAKG